MDRKYLSQYEPWNFSRPSISKRSVLYNLKPMKIGTGSVECLTSYVKRLAKAHSLSPGILLQRFLASHMNKPYWSHGGARSGTNGSALAASCSEHAKAINGVGIIARDWVVALQSLTLRTDLESLSMLRWSAVFTQRNLLRQSLAWCPSCYASRRLNNEPVYDPLLWAFRCVTMCVKHNRRLRSRCRCCGTQLQWLGRRSRPGYCSKCGEWLGAEETADDQCEAGDDLSLTELEWQAYITHQLENLISASIHLPLPTQQRVATALSVCIDRATDGNTSRFAQLIGKTKNTVWGWQHGLTRIPVDDLLRICRCVGIGLVDLLYHDGFSFTDIDVVHRVSVSGVTTIRRSPRKVDLKATKRALITTLKEEPSLPMKAIAARLGINKRILYKHFPELCKRIAARHRQYQIQVKQTRQSISARQIVDTTMKLQDLGIYPSRRRVARAMRASEGQSFLTETGDKANRLTLAA